MKSWYSIKNKGDAAVNLSIHDEIGLWGVSAAEFIKDLRAISSKNINLSIHSPGGNLLDGFAIHNSLVAHPAKIHGHVDGIAASAASVILMAADVISMPEDSFMMIHAPHGGTYGNSEDLREMADIMDKMQNSIVNIYKKRTGQTEESIKEMVAAETWMTAAEAQTMGFADFVTDKIGIAAKAVNFSEHFKKLPFDSDYINSIENERDLERFLRDSGVSKNKAVEIIAKSKAMFSGDPGPANDKQLTELLNRLETFKLPERLI